MRGMSLVEGLRWDVPQASPGPLWRAHAMVGVGGHILRCVWWLWEGTCCGSCGVLEGTCCGACGGREQTVCVSLSGLSTTRGCPLPPNRSHSPEDTLASRSRDT